MQQRYIKPRTKAPRIGISQTVQMLRNKEEIKGVSHISVILAFRTSDYYMQHEDEGEVSPRTSAYSNILGIIIIIKFQLLKFSKKADISSPVFSVSLQSCSCCISVSQHKCILGEHGLFCTVQPNYAVTCCRHHHSLQNFPLHGTAL